MRQPNFFILGAPKCGTTSLARWLADHPQVYMSPVKEPHYYSTDLANRTIRSQKRYEALFRAARYEHRAIGEASTWYLFSKDAIPAIENAHPEARYIVMTRDPVGMAHSLYHHNCRVLHEDQPTFEAAWCLQADRAVGQSLPRFCTEPSFLQYKAACSLGSLLDRLYAQVPDSRVLHVPLEWVRSDPAAQYRRILAFLGLDDDERKAFPVANEARGHRSPLAQRILRLGGRVRIALGFNRGLGLAKLNERARQKPILSREFQLELEQTFEEERSRLNRFIERASVLDREIRLRGHVVSDAFGNDQSRLGGE
ncbi:sulfotransferase [Ectothiorhodospira haloalkaliphila]|uniref:sulfotransferase family protein n=1 Tax=Ectothiorhodospira haloalkaliphila TaxID=421628 RepID=UPI001EE85EB0|nr:sulfotransferase [Ectothiorhodospira haloalkaliphila]MCG5525277.1 sulfotransferase [Ectothiorhodospira haloalkaliphila]